jgi:hypothetical protein
VEQVNVPNQNLDFGFHAIDKGLDSTTDPTQNARRTLFRRTMAQEQARTAGRTNIYRFRAFQSYDPHIALVTHYSPQHGVCR